MIGSQLYVIAQIDLKTHEQNKLQHGACSILASTKVYRHGQYSFFFTDAYK